MKIVKTFIIAVLLMGAAPTTAQTVDEIIQNYFENIGGVDKLNNIKAIQMEGVVNFNGMELPVTMTQTASGKSMIKAEFQGQQFYQNVYDGETLWGTNQMTMAAEKSDAEATSNYKLEINDFPDPFLNYKEKGYTLELLGSETMEGTETYKIKLVKEPIMVDGKEEQNISYYYFDSEAYVPIVVEQEVRIGPAAGMVGQTKLSGYEEVDGVYFPFSITESAKGQPGGQEIIIKKITLNPELDDSMFMFPEKE